MIYVCDGEHGTVAYTVRINGTVHYSLHLNVNLLKMWILYRKRLRFSNVMNMKNTCLVNVLAGIVHAVINK